ncbi:MAG: sterol desaturase family protein [Rubrivivax sp.]|nr:sterol desaturase family protein [Rubrivivax sp.]
MNTLTDLFGQAQQALFEGLMQPLIFGLGMGNLLEDGFVATGWLLVGLLQIAIMLSLFRALERWRPVEPLVDRAAVRVDVIYTLIHRLGLFRVALFFSVEPLWTGLVGQLRVAGLPAVSLDDLRPGVTDIAWVSFVLYLVFFDAVHYGLHRAQHRFGWWWQLHALHHSQRQMTMWSDNRNHLLDDLLVDSAVVFVALGVGIGPAQFVGVVAVTQLLESLSHANLRTGFGPLLGRVFVSPRFHRHHHAIAEWQGTGTPDGHNFSVLFPLWDMLFGTARFDGRYAPTGVPDQLQGREYGRGFWAQQWLGLRRLAGR